MDQNPIIEIKQKLGRGGKNTEKNYKKKDLKYLDNCNGVVTYIEPHILKSTGHYYKQS